MGKLEGGSGLRAWEWKEAGPGPQQGCWECPQVALSQLTVASEDHLSTLRSHLLPEAAHIQ